MPAITVIAVIAGTDTLTATAHGLLTGDRFRLRNVGGALPAATPALAAVTDYFAIRVDADNVKVAVSSANANAGTAVDITGAGSGTTTVEYGLPFCIPRIAAAGSQVFSADDNATWNSLVSMYALLTGQAQSVWSGVALAVPITTDVGTLGKIRGICALEVGLPAATGGTTTNDLLPTADWNQSTAPTLLTPVITGAGTWTITGINNATFLSRVIRMYNHNSQSIQLNHNDAGSSAANRFRLPGGANLTVATGGIVTLLYINNSAPGWYLESKNF